MFTCLHCPRTFTNPAALGGHQRSHKEPTVRYKYFCLNCNANTPNKKYCSTKCQHIYQTATKRAAGTLTTGTLRKHILKERGHKCEECGIIEWNGKPIIFEMDHKDGNHENNDPSNLKILCPNCHSQTPTYRAKNKGSGRKYRMERYHSGLSS